MKAFSSTRTLCAQAAAKEQNLVQTSGSGGISAVTPFKASTQEQAHKKQSCLRRDRAWRQSRRDGQQPVPFSEISAQTPDRPTSSLPTHAASLLSPSHWKSHHCNIHQLPDAQCKLSTDSFEIHTHVPPEVFLSPPEPTQLLAIFHISRLYVVL